MANLISFFILIVFLYGRSLRFTNLRWHITLMLAAFICDLGLIAALVFGRNALGTVAGGEMSVALWVHVPTAVVTVVLYFGAVWTGFALWRGRDVRARLRWLDRCLLVFRVLTLVTSIWVQISSAP